MRNERGATAVEYGLLAALIIVGLWFSLDALGVSLSWMIECEARGLENPTNPC